MHASVSTPLFALALSACGTTNDQTAMSDSTTTRARSAAPERRVLPYEVRRAELENGLSVLMIPMQSGGLVSYWTVVRTGSRDEIEPGVTGFAHFFEHMMFRGTERHPGKVYDGIVHGMGADANAYTTDDYTAYHMSVSRESLPTVIDVEADRFQNLAYDEAAFRTEAGAVYGEYRKNRSSPFNVMFEALQNAAFDAHTYKHTTMGFEADIQAMPTRYEYSKSFFKRFYRPENVVIVVAGDFDPALTLREIRAKYGNWKRGYEATEVPVEPQQPGMRRIDVPFDGQTLPVLVLAFKAPAFDPNDRAALAGGLVGELAFGSTSAIYKKLVLDEQRVEQLGAFFQDTRDPGLWLVYALVKNPADVRKVEGELWGVVESLARETVPAHALDAVRSNRRYEFLSGLATPDGTASSLARYVALTGDVACVDTMFDTLARVTPEDLRTAAQRWLVADRCTVATVYPRGQDVPKDPLPTSTFLARAPAATPVVTPLDGSGSERLTQAPVLLPVSSDPTVSIQIWVQAGSQDDPPGQEGLAALTAAMVSDGATQARSYDDVLRALFPMSAGYGASVDREMTIVGGGVHRDHAARFARLLAEAVATPAFAQDDFERLRDQAISSIENDLRYASGEELAKAALYERAFQDSRYAHVETGRVAALKALTVADVRRFHKERWTRDSIVLGVGGAYDTSLPEALSAALASKLAAGAPRPTPAPEPARFQGRQAVIVDNPDASGVSISMGVPVSVRRGTKEFGALWLANTWLGQHRNSLSRLYQVIREARGLNYGDYSYIEAFPRGGSRTTPPTGVGRRAQLFELWIRTIPSENAPFAIRAALREVELLVQNGMTQEQFESTRDFLRGYASHYAESTHERLGYAIDDRYYGLDGYLDSFRGTLDSLTLEDVNAAVRAHMRLDNVLLCAVSNDAAALRQALIAGEPTPVQYPEGIEKPESIRTEDEAIASWPLVIESVEVRPVASLFE